MLKRSAKNTVDGLILTIGVIILVMVVGFYLYIGIACLIQRFKEKKFTREMRRRNRFKEWGDIEAKQESGSIIVEQAQKEGCRVWWTPEKVSELTPYDIPEEHEVDYMRLEEPLPFVVWCNRRYTSTAEGKAFLTEIPFKVPPGFLTLEFLRTKTKVDCLVATVLLAEQDAAPQIRPRW